MTITLVKKVMASGEPCAKCADVERRLVESGLMQRIDRVVVADERDPQSEGMALARRHGVQVAPFFLLEENGETSVHTVYLKFAREVLGDRPRQSGSGLDEAQEMLRANPDLDLL